MIGRLLTWSTMVAAFFFKCCLMSTETIRTIRDGEPRTTIACNIRTIWDGEPGTTIAYYIRILRDGEPRMPSASTST